MHRILVLLSVIVLCQSCTKKESENTFKGNSKLVAIANLQDRRASDSLVIYFNDENSAVRERAVLAFASVQDSTIVSELNHVLTTDADSSVRIAAAIALGQTRCSASEQFLKNAIDKEAATNVRNAIIEGYGKVARSWDLAAKLAEQNPSGISWSLYRAGFNNAVDPSRNAIAASLLLPNQNDFTRLGAAHFFNRGAREIGPQFPVIANSATTDKNVDVRMAAAGALRKILSDSSFLTLEKIYDDEDYRVRISAVRGFQAFPFERSKNNLIKALRDKNINVAIAASEAIKAIITENYWTDIANAASESKHWRVQANLYEAVLKVKNNKGIIDEVTSLYKTANPYQKRALLYALQNQPSNAAFIQQELLSANDLVVKSSAAEALVFINKSKVFDKALKRQFAQTYQKAIENGDPGVIGNIAGALADSTLDYRAVVTDYTFLSRAKSKLTPKKDDDAIAALDKSLAYFEKKKFEPRTPPGYNHPINWSRISDLSSAQTVTVYTTKGKIKMRLLTQEAPGSVANFLDLVDKQYFNNHYFHRVVPNFVIQVGDHRGDGSGGEDYSIRSEFTKTRYTTGSVGMASSGKDTEGTQWFITHSPTPHLDGRYSIFAEVVEGIETVHRIEIGDQITKIELDKSGKQ